jgi:hypothetical protein
MGRPAMATGTARDEPAASGWLLSFMMLLVLPEVGWLGAGKEDASRKLQEARKALTGVRGACGAQRGANGSSGDARA